MPISFPELRIALLRLAEEPPIRLADTAFVKTLLPDVADRLERGKQAQKALYRAILSLRPQGAIVPDDPRWWQYLICVREYEQERPRKDVRAGLGIEEVAYTRAKFRALARIDDVLPYMIGEHERAVGE